MSGFPLLLCLGPGGSAHYLDDARAVGGGADLHKMQPAGQRGEAHRCAGDAAAVLQAAGGAIDVD